MEIRRKSMTNLDVYFQKIILANCTGTTFNNKAENKVQ